MSVGYFLCFVLIFVFFLFSISYFLSFCIVLFFVFLVFVLFFVFLCLFCFVVFCLFCFCVFSFFCLFLLFFRFLYFLSFYETTNASFMKLHQGDLMSFTNELLRPYAVESNNDVLLLALLELSVPTAECNPAKYRPHRR